ncbi:hypothetical protein BH09GEM1_BH09GEM1_37760 [soil metagenome]
MKVGDWQEERRDGVLRLSARITWEDQDRADEMLWFAWPANLAESVHPEPDAALVALYPLAVHSGERRLAVAGKVSSRLADGVESAMAVVAGHSSEFQPVALDLTYGGTTSPRSGRDAAVCLSGGVDALAAVQQNVATTSLGDRERFASALFILGLNTFDFVGGEPSAERVTAYDAHALRLEGFAEANGMSLLRCTTNLRALIPSFDEWEAVANTSHLAAAGHLMRPRIATLAIGSSGRGYLAGVIPHPLIDALHATDALLVHGAQVMMTRLEKVRRLVEWPEGLAVLRVCLMIDMPKGGQLNCGNCEKCVRTMLDLLAIGGGALTRAPFPVNDVSADLARHAMRSSNGRAFCKDLVPLLAARGRHDLAAALTIHANVQPEPRQPWWRRRPR